MEKTVVILFGSHNSEHLVSVASAQNLASCLPHAALWYWAPTGQVHEVSHATLAQHQNPFLEEFTPATVQHTWQDIKASLDSEQAQSSVFLLALHGSIVEDGTLQKWLEERKLAFTGSSSHSSYLAFHKTLAKDAVQKAGLLVAPSMTFHSHVTQEEKAQLANMVKLHGQIVLKPVADGSSVGLYFAHSPQELEQCLSELASKPSRLYLAEAFIKGIELTIGVVQMPEGLVALPGTEICSEEGHVFDYMGKYLGKGTQEITPPRVSAQLLQEAQQIALSAHRALMCDGYSRTDAIASQQGIFFIELNSLPGLTKASLVPQQLKAAGITMQDFITQQLNLAIQRQGQAI